MAKPFEQDVVLGADGKPLFDAVDTLARKIENIQKTIAKIQTDSFKSAKDFNATLDANVKSLQRASQQLSTLQRQDATARRQERALAASQARENAGKYGTNTTRIGYEFEKEKAIAQLKAATNEKERQAGLKAVELANARLAAIEKIARQEEAIARQQATANKQNGTEAHRARLQLSRQYAQEQTRILGTEAAVTAAKNSQVRAELALQQASNVTRQGRLRDLELANAQLRAVERLAAAERRQAAASSGGSGGGRGISNILTPGYAGAAFARTSVYGVAAMAAYGAFNTAQGSVANAAQMEDELARLQAIAGATDTQMQTLKASIFAIGTTSRFATVDLIKISQTLAQAGVAAGDMQKVLSSVTALATASGSTPDEAVQLVTSALGSFQLSASESARIADLMTEALNRTKLTVQQVGQAIQYVGATAYEQNISLEQMLATIGSVAQAGVKSGSTIGTGFRQFLVDLQEPSKKLTEQLKLLGLSAGDVDVSVRGLPAVLDTLRNAGFGAAQAYEGLETRAAAFYLTAKNNVDVADMLQLSFSYTTASIVAQERAMNSFSAQWQRFKNIIGQGFAESFDNILTTAQNLLRQISDRMTEVQNIAQQTRDRQAAGIEKGYGGNALAYYWEKSWTPEAERGLELALNWAFPKTSSAGTGGVGTWLKELGQNSDGASEATERLATRISDTSSKIDEHKTRVAELDKEIVRLITQKESLRNNDVRSAAETATLTSRFVGLANQLTVTGNRYDDLVNAARRYRVEQLRLMGVELQVQQLQLGQAARESQTSLKANLRGLSQNNDAMSALSMQERHAVRGLYQSDVGSAEFTRNLGILSAAVDRLAKSGNKNADVIAKAVGPAGTYASTTAQRNAILPAIGAAQAGQTPLGQRLTNDSQTLSALIEQLGSAEGKNKTQLTNQANSLINSMDRLIASRLKPGVNDAGAQFLRGMQQDVNSFRQQVKALNTATDAEVKASERATKAKEREQKAAEREADRGPPLTQKDFDAVITGLGLPLGSGPRTKAQQNDLHRRGLTPATGDTSAHSTGGLVRDIPTGPMTKEEGDRLAQTVRQAFKNRGITVFAQFETGQGRNQGTGPHVHVQGQRGQRLKGGIGAKDPGDAEFKYDTQLDAAQLELDRAALASELKNLAGATTKAAFDASVVAAQTAMNKVNTDLRDAALNELANAGVGPSSPLYQAKMLQVEQSIAQNMESFQAAMAEAMIKSTQATIKAAQEAFEASISPSQRALSVLQGQASGLDRYSLRGQVTDSARTLADARVRQAQETADRARLAAMPTQIDAQQSAINDLAAQSRNPLLSADTVANLNLKILELQNNLEGLKTTRDALAASFGAEGLLPKTLGEGLDQAIAAYKEMNNLNLTFTQMVNGEMLGAIGTLQSALTNMFTSIMDGSRSVVGAMVDFAKAIMQAIMQIIAKIIATQIIKLLFQLFAPGQPMPAGVQQGGEIRGDTASVSSSSTPPGQSVSMSRYNGGPIRGYTVGGQVMAGHSMRDSTLARLSKGEFVMRKAAVDSVGTDFMHKLNRKGAQALENTQAMPKIDVRPRMESNIWMVKPDEVPSMGPNDVLVTWQRDVLSGGESRRLIQHVARESF